MRGSTVLQKNQSFQDRDFYLTEFHTIQGDLCPIRTLGKVGKSKHDDQTTSCGQLVTEQVLNTKSTTEAVLKGEYIPFV